MKMNLKYSSIGLLLFFYLQIDWCNPETITFFNTERPVVNWIDQKCFKNFTIYSRRLNRRDPRHYVEIYAHPLIYIDNNITVHFYFYQFLTNRYKPSFVELHFKFCDMMNSDTLIGKPMRNALGGQLCPYPPGEYDMKNMTMSYVPRGFPFTKGRIYCNATRTTGINTEIIARGSIDMEVKVFNTNGPKGMQDRRDLRHAGP